MAEHQADEAYRSLRSTIKYAEGERPIHTVLVVEVDGDEPGQVGRNLTAAFARAGDNCVHVNANLHAPTADAPGLSDLIAGRASVCEVVDEADDRVATIAPGTIGNPDLISGQGFGTALEAISSRYDYVILSCAPLPANSDALALAPHVDATILVILQGVTRRQQAVEARDALDRVGANVLGLVMVERERRWWL